MISKKKILKLKSDWILFLPILFIFFVDIILLGKNYPVSDGIRYWKTASDLLNGFKDTPILDGYLLLNGPFYPIYLAILKSIGFSVKASILTNAIMLYIGFVYFYKTLLNHLSRNKALVATYVLVFIDPFLFYWGAKLYSEPLAIMLVCLIIYQIDTLIKSYSLKKILIVSVLFSLLILTRVIFAYVLLTLLFVLCLLYLIHNNSLIKRGIKLISFSLLFCIPYLIFTYTVTQKVFYWSANGGGLLYWTSSPYKIDLGEWHTLQINHDHFAARYNDFSGLDSIYLRQVNDVIINKINENHKEFSESLEGKNIIEYDDALKQKSIENIKQFPLAFFKNWILNTGRLLVGIPHALYSKPPFSPHFTLLNTVKSSFLLFALIFSILLAIRNFKNENLILIAMIIFLLIYLGGQSLLAVQSQRFLLPVYPIIIFIISLSLQNNLTLKQIKNENTFNSNSCL